jgi:hypothetical protein
MALTKATNSMIQGAPINVLDFGAVGDGVTDDTAAIQAAIVAALGGHQIVHIPAGNYLVTDTLSVYDGTQIQGDTNYAYGSGFGRDPKGSKIDFQPTSGKVLFNYIYDVTPTPTPPTFLFHTSICGLFLSGNSFATVAISLNAVIYGNFSNLTIETFDTGIYCYGTINNRFENVLITSCVNRCVSYAGAAETTDVWDSCTFFGTPIGVYFGSVSIAIRFTNCLFEQLDDYGMDISRECQSILATDCYAEDVPYSTDATTRSMFRVGYEGVALTIENHLIVTGGKYAGKNAGPTGSFLNVNYSNGVIVQGVNVSRFTNFLKANNTNCLDNSVILSGTTGIGISDFFVDESDVATDSKVAGSFANGVINSGSFHQNAKYGQLITEFLSYIKAGVQVTGGVITDNSTVSNYQDVREDAIVNSTWRKVAEQTASVSTAPVVVVPNITGGTMSGSAVSYIKVYGSDNAGAFFFDVVIASNTAGAVTVLSSTTIAGSPAVRTYTAAAAAMSLAMGSGTYNVNCSVETVDYPF